MKSVKFFVLIPLLISPLAVLLFFRSFRVHARAWAGSANAMYELSEGYNESPPDYYGRVPRWLPYDPEQCQYWLTKAAENGSLEAINDHVRKYQYPPYQPRLFLMWAQKGADLGDMFCMIELTKAYEYGLWGVNKDEQKFKHWKNILDTTARKHPQSVF